MGMGVPDANQIQGYGYPDRLGQTERYEMSESGVARATSPMDEALKILAQNLDHLNEEVVSLRNRLEPVMRDDPPRLAEDQPLLGETANNSAHVRAVRFMADRVHAQHVEVARIRSLLDV